jgi:ATP-dependent DNA helicase PIF1
VFEKGALAPTRDAEPALTPPRTGQAYVAISRATSLEGIWVVGFDARKVMCHPRVLEWSKTLNTLVPPKAE